MKYVIVIVVSFLTVAGHSQILPGNQDQVGVNDFYTVQAAMNQYYLEHPGAKGEKVWRRKEWFLEPRLYPSGKFENLTLKTLKTYRNFLSQQPQVRATHGQWSFLGPTNVNGGGYIPGIGRVNCFAIHPTNENIIYIGTSNGGIWKTINGGTSWTNISPDLPLLAVTDIGFDPNNANIIYVLTGDGDPGDFTGHIIGSVSSIGIIKSNDAGNSWLPTGFSFSYPSAVTPTALLINPLHADTQFVAAKNGVYKTVNNWTSYTTLLAGQAIYDIEYHPVNTQIMYCAGMSWIRRSASHGSSWSLVTDDDFIGWNSGVRIELAVTPHLPSAVYALVGGPMGNPTIGIYKSLLEGINNTWSTQDTTTELLDGQPWYNIAMAVKDTDHNDVFVGGVWARRSYTSGLTWDTINYLTIHADVHDIQYRNGKLYMATDGGFHRSTDDGNSWTNLWSGLAITEIYRISGTPQDAGLYYCGNQDNGIMKRNGSSTFTLEISGDGMVTQINYMNADTVFGCVNNGDCHRSVDGYQSWAVMQIPSGPGEWVAPMIMDPAVPSIIFVARDSIYRSNSSGSDSSWIYLGQPLPASANCLKQGTDNRNKLYASRQSQIQRTDNALTNTGPATWVNVSAGLPNLFISDIAVDPADANEVYVCLSGYTDGKKVYKSTSGGSGASWTNITGSLPNVPINCIEFHNSSTNGLYVGTDIGVFYRDDNLADWIYYSNNLPAVVVNDLYINTTSNKIVAGTYGRGMWQSDLFAGCDQDLTLLDFGNQIGGTRFYSVTNVIQSVQRHKPDLGTEVHYSAGNYIDLKLGFEVSGLGFFEGKIGPCPPPYDAPMLSPELPKRPFILTDHFYATLLQAN